MGLGFRKACGIINGKAHELRSKKPKIQGLDLPE